MKKKISCGILFFRFKNNKIQFFLVHPGGPYNKKAKWGISKGQIEESDNDYKDTAIREVNEELGVDFSFYKNQLISLGKIEQNQKKIVYCYAHYHDFGDNFIVKSNMTEIEFPPKSGKLISIPEIDNGKYFTYSEAKQNIITLQLKFIDRLINKLKILL